MAHRKLKMSFTNKNDNIISSKVYPRSPQSESKKIILIELTSILIVVAFILFKTVLYFCPEEFWLSPTELQHLLYPLASWLTSSPLVFGALISFITWHLMYFDSAEPGINPPTPLSPSKYRAMSGADVHLNFLFAIAIGPMVTTLMHFEYVISSVAAFYGS